MFGAATAPASGFGKAPGGFGTMTNTSTNTTTATGGFGAASGFGAPSAAPTAAVPSFGAATTTAPSATAPTGFGAAASNFRGGGGFGAASAGGGFGAPAGGTTGGFGGGFGVPQQQQPGTAMQGFGFGSQPQPMMAPQQPQQPPTVTLQDFTRQSALASYLVHLDQSYNALSTKCHFTTFVYNSCGPGQMMDAIQKERYTAYLHGGGCSDEAYMQALQKNPSPGRLYPSPLHFSQELLKRTEKQKEAIAVLQAKVGELMQDVDTVAAMDAANVQRQREVEQEELMLRHRWYALLRKMELLRRNGSSYGEESLLSSRVEQLRQHLKAPAQFGQLLHELRPFLSEEVSRVAMMTQQRRPASPPPSRAPAAGIVAAPAAFRSASGRPLLRSEVDPYIMKDWMQFAKQMQDGIETLNELLKTDLKEMRAIRARVESA
ncbi:putative nucleoporin (NUP54/57) [Leptomonas seymouri]|uniref:Putative nucleoporin (NUP54/57) n=1 Tax=Leptomonas seymouri TaxID=5684 RepID=A0A0N1IK03_LEPSE|nr:putative nucleoporin (NUP54/57) [Leptomonas seymouri]|eukprot:KPI85700.1 putative nucleoporin (NUP54/57) [Leptomonas seymouri]